ncbi:MAG TPA: hypothetical protein PKW66_16680, partial [Polyangiaceae bacterium]|nr:hypothetical protein [Polyangiaceae bacterium]
LDQWQHAIDERIRAVLPSFSLFLDIQAEMRRLTQRVQFLEERFGQKQRASEGGKEPAESTMESGKIAPPPGQDATPKE